MKTLTASQCFKLNPDSQMMVLTNTIQDVVPVMKFEKFGKTCENFDIYI